MAQDKLHITLHVYDTEMSVNVPRDEEIFYRRAAKEITDTINTYASIFNGRKTEKELMYMALIDIALRYEKGMNVEDILKSLTKEVEEVL